eukprot:CAMPEP_0118966198 /NCGR_PEP_ID=MMETSP1173-20130426/3698_1 /TAXON_ID=1034831 /ORGANISM="Rhizochromulina marina cf, Strain CCMP1243" /LENGTH=134 /DNA_ID=CAMNT_0006914937 /DNA_START=113 /DNA_END=517 /DNA_ORIENTATION=-
MTCFHDEDRSLYISGHLPITAAGELLTGRLGNGGLSVDEGYQAARWVGLNFLATLKQELGDLDRVEKVVKLLGVVNSEDDFINQHLVMNGCSDLFMEVFGKEVGYHARSAFGTNTLPLNVPVEAELLVRVRRAN